MRLTIRLRFLQLRRGEEIPRCAPGKILHGGLLFMSFLFVVERGAASLADGCAVSSRVTFGPALPIFAKIRPLTGEFRPLSR